MVPPSAKVTTGFWHRLPLSRRKNLTSFFLTVTPMILTKKYFRRLPSQQRGLQQILCFTCRKGVSFNPGIKIPHLYLMLLPLSYGTASVQVGLFCLKYNLTIRLHLFYRSMSVLCFLFLFVYKIQYHAQKQHTTHHITKSYGNTALYKEICQI